MHFKGSKNVLLVKYWWKISGYVKLTAMKTIICGNLINDVRGRRLANLDVKVMSRTSKYEYPLNTSKDLTSLGGWHHFTFDVTLSG